MPHYGYQVTNGNSGILFQIFKKPKNHQLRRLN